MLPIACTLGPDDGAQRMDDWRRIVGIASAGSETRPGMLILRFRDEPTVAEELARLVAAERDCCGFLGWKLVQSREEWQVEITGDDDALQTLTLG